MQFVWGPRFHQGRPGLIKDRSEECCQGPVLRPVILMLSASMSSDLIQQS